MELLKIYLNSAKQQGKDSGPIMRATTARDLISSRGVCGKGAARFYNRFSPKFRLIDSG